MIESISWSILCEAVGGIWIMFYPRLPKQLRLNRLISIVSIISWIILWGIARNATEDSNLEIICGISGWGALIIFLVSSFILSCRFNKTKKTTT